MSSGWFAPNAFSSHAKRWLSGDLSGTSDALFVVITKTPPGLSTRATSHTASSGRSRCSITSLITTTSNEASRTGRASRRRPGSGRSTTGAARRPWRASWLRRGCGGRRSRGRRTLCGVDVEQTDGHEHRTAPDVEHRTSRRQVLPTAAGDEVVAHLVAVLVVLAPDVELLLDGRHPLVVVPGERVPVRRPQQVPLVRRLGQPSQAIALVAKMLFMSGDHRRWWVTVHRRCSITARAGGHACCRSRRRPTPLVSVRGRGPRRSQRCGSSSRRAQRWLGGERRRRVRMRARGGQAGVGEGAGIVGCAHRARPGTDELFGRGVVGRDDRRAARQRLDQRHPERVEHGRQHRRPRLSVPGRLIRRAAQRQHRRGRAGRLGRLSRTVSASPGPLSHRRTSGSEAATSGRASSRIGTPLRRSSMAPEKRRVGTAALEGEGSNSTRSTPGGRSSPLGHSRR